MGSHPNVGPWKYPKQGEFRGKRTKVCFNRDPSKEVMGTIIRSDHEDPWLTIIQLDDGRVVLGTECQYSPITLSAGHADPRMGPVNPITDIRFDGKPIDEINKDHAERREQHGNQEGHEKEAGPRDPGKGGEGGECGDGLPALDAGGEFYYASGLYLGPVEPLAEGGADSAGERDETAED